MKILTWNCRGLGKPLTVHSLKGICRSHSPEVVFLYETKNQPLFVSNILGASGYNNCFCVDPIGIVGGLVVGWKDTVQASIQDHKRFFIHLKVEDLMNMID